MRDWKISSYRKLLKQEGTQLTIALFFLYHFRKSLKLTRLTGLLPDRVNKVESPSQTEGSWAAKKILRQCELQKDSKRKNLQSLWDLQPGEEVQTRVSGKPYSLTYWAACRLCRALQVSQLFWRGEEGNLVMQLSLSPFCSCNFSLIFLYVTPIKRTGSRSWSLVLSSTWVCCGSPVWGE